MERRTARGRCRTRRDAAARTSWSRRLRGRAGPLRLALFHRIAVALAAEAASAPVAGHLPAISALPVTESEHIVVHVIALIARPLGAAAASAAAASAVAAVATAASAAAASVAPASIAAVASTTAAPRVASPAIMPSTAAVAATAAAQEVDEIVDANGAWHGSRPTAATGRLWGRMVPSEQGRCRRHAEEGARLRALAALAPVPRRLTDTDNGGEPPLDCRSEGATAKAGAGATTRRRAEGGRAPEEQAAGAPSAPRGIAARKQAASPRRG